MIYLRKLYEWIFGWAKKPSGPKALAKITFAESSFSRNPLDVLLIPIDEKIFKS